MELPAFMIAGGGGGKDVDRFKAANIQPDQWLKDPGFYSRVSAFYMDKWNQHNIGSIPDQLQGIVFGGIINQGPRVVKFLQEELQAMHQTLDADGLMGPETITALSKVETPILVKMLWKRRAEAYRDAVSSNPADAKFLHGWLLRLGQGA